MTMFRLSRTPKLALIASSFALTCALGTGVAHAQEPNGGQPLPTPPAAQPCPPGSWFCGDTQAQGATSSKDLQPLPGTAGAEAPPSQNGVTYSGQAPAPPPVVIYQPAPSRPTVVVVNGKEPPPPYLYKPRPAPRRSEWGINLHLEGMPIAGKGAADGAGMGGLGFGVRYRPSPYAAIEPDLDFITGKDYNGNKRSEAAFGLNCLIFVNPKSKVQVYFPIGFGWSWAHVNQDDSYYASNDSYWSSYGDTKDYTYFGGQAGVGLEFRVAKHFALNFDVRGFVRGRVDHDANTNYAQDYEFTSSDGRHTNTSGGAIINGGMTFYF
ncbi:MAG TPA: outer membrane beta-barrel protein [Polyangiaceae bacterium]